MSAQLDAVSKAKQAYVIAKTTLEQRLREDLRKELANLQAQVDLAVRFAFESGESKAEIMRSMGTKDYHTLNASLDRTSAVTEIKGVDPLDKCYSYHLDTAEFTVTYDRHGPSEISGAASFLYRVLDDGTKWFMASTPLWNDDFTVRNDVVAALDNKQDGYYYQEALYWVERVISGK
jgi:hypothetical protein